MGKVIKIGIAKIKGSPIVNANSIEVIKGKGIVNDRKFKESNEKERQITLIEIENIVSTMKKIILTYKSLFIIKFYIKYGCQIKVNF